MLTVGCLDRGWYPWYRMCSRCRHRCRTKSTRSRSWTSCCTLRPNRSTRRLVRPTGGMRLACLSFTGGTFTVLVEQLLICEVGWLVGWGRAGSDNSIAVLAVRPSHTPESSFTGYRFDRIRPAGTTTATRQRRCLSGVMKRPSSAPWIVAPQHMNA